MYENRKSAGKILAKRLKKLQEEGKIKDPVVVALPRGGVPVGVEIAKELNAPLDLLFVKKIPAPGNEELAIGSVSENGIMFVNEALVSKFGVDEDYLREKGIEKIQEMARLRDKYKKEPVLLEGKDVILVDDGIATGASMYLAAQSIVRDMPNNIIIAAPVAPNDEQVLNMLQSVSHHLEILETPNMFMSVGKWYDDFHQLSDEEVQELLKEVK
ncbi:phosphoribosyltransferase [Nautilia sp. PV-1]|jgi:predicted phosphoribosyltransferase|uniref:phosphoribosyltransferase n=1 Tax=Nautilia sp. PV-1 TaxID=2579250 RepID=UPI000FDA6641|nr:phosphoribosyltransferase family protein [Nautilia sp. PV-1]AZV46742.1 phosphoribosyltransferase [Nautilia sp. PV-1]